MPILLIDGHNLLYAARSAFAEHVVDGHPGSAAREALIDWLQRRFDGCACAVRLYFDGPAARHEQPAPRLDVIYSGGHGAQRADAVILRQLTEYTASAGEAVLVTRDVKLARRARKRGAVIVDPVRFCIEHGLLQAQVTSDSG